MSPQIQPEWVQYGSFGLIAFLVIVGLPGGLFWLWKAVQNAFTYHKTIIEGLTKTFTEDSARCREAQERMAQRAESKDEKDRQSRHELANSIQQLSGQVEMMIDHRKA